MPTFRLPSGICPALVLAAWLPGTAFAAAAAADPSPPAGRDLRQVLGVTHVAGKYNLTDKQFLVEGADQIAALPSTGREVLARWYHTHE